MRNSFSLLFSCCLLIACHSKGPQKSEPLKIAFLADVHLHDIYAEFVDTDYKGFLNPETGKHNVIRTMGSQLRSTRLFNENYFAFLAALDDLVKKDIKLVVLPGDFSDDGQPVNIWALKRILNEYKNTYGIQFFLTTGNHDPVRPFSTEGGKTDFLGAGGKEQLIFSDSSLIDSGKDYPLHPVITKGIQKWGYLEILNTLSNFGFYPQKEFLYWETPYTTYDYNSYDFELAKKEAALVNRVYQPLSAISIPDATYLVEPVEGLWLLAIDGNVYIPTVNTSQDLTNGNDFSGASLGYNHVLDYKRQLIPWIEKVVKKAKKRGKTLVAFSHYPMVEFNDGASDELKVLFGLDKMQNHRIPKEEVSKVFADAGIQLHIGGHMHYNDTGIHTSQNGHTLYNVQVPSLAAYPSAYKIATIHSGQKIEFQTILLDNVAGFNSLFTLYKKEYQHLDESNESKIWNKEVLQVNSYSEFTELHLKELVRLRFLEEDWPAEFKNKLIYRTGKELLFLNASKTPANVTEFQAYAKWTGLDMVQDFYRLKNGDDLAKKEIGPERLEQYTMVSDNLIQFGDKEMVLWGKLFKKIMNGQPSDHFIIDLQKGTLEKM
ncbi:MAG: metallophosphoesterase [Maribacter sp.]